MSGAKPSFSKTPGRKFSTSTSASSMRCKNSSRSVSSFRFNAMVRLLRFTNRHHKPSPSTRSRHPMLRKLSPPSGRSILMTSAPKSARYRAQFGPARTVDRSRTRKPAKADVLFNGAEESGIGLRAYPMRSSRSQYRSLHIGADTVRSMTMHQAMRCDVPLA
ncbi:unannotated protein [freshwater metagenome]|uniref:Unannotated protein n=1 Tax=freshwater metagenome TaxID=449393 RepID=A0A6J7TTM7_9ZZZZ